jgi:serine/threonine-protein kinase
VLFEALEGKPPFTGDNPLSVAFKHVHEPLPALSRPDVPRALEEVLLKALAKNPMDRYQNAREMLNDLDALSGNRDTKALALTTPEPTAILAPVNRREKTDRRNSERRGTGSQSALAGLGWNHPVVILGTALVILMFFFVALTLWLLLGHR